MARDTFSANRKFELGGITILYNLKCYTDGLMHWEKDKEGTTAAPREWFWWRPYYRAPAADIEMTAYALMTYVLGAEEDPSLIGQAMPIVRWLTKQRNALGGFASTQVGTHTGHPSVVQP